MLLLISTYLRPRRVAHSITSSVRAARHSPSLECPDNPLAGTDSTSKLRSDGLAMVDDTLLRRKWCSVDEEFAPDSPLEGTGFEPSVPPDRYTRLVSSWCRFSDLPRHPGSLT
jgi:hypothetical protein